MTTQVQMGRFGEVEFPFTRLAAATAGGVRLSTVDRPDESCDLNGL
jgi:hypothetical protein